MHLGWGLVDVGPAVAVGIEDPEQSDADLPHQMPHNPQPLSMRLVEYERMIAVVEHRVCPMHYAVMVRAQQREIPQRIIPAP